MIERQSERVAGISIETWANLKATETGQPVELLAPAALCVEAVGLFANGSVKMQGSNAKEPGPIDWNTVIDKFGVPVEFNAPGFRVIDSVPRHLRPSASGGKDMDVSVIVLVRGLS